MFKGTVSTAESILRILIDGIFESKVKVVEVARVVALAASLSLAVTLI